MGIVGSLVGRDHLSRERVVLVCQEEEWSGTFGVESSRLHILMRLRAYINGCSQFPRTEMEESYSL